MKNQAGLSLLELLMTIAILGVLVRIGVPSWRHWINTNHIEITQAELIRNLQFARQIAMEKKEKVIICPSVDNKSCSENWTSPYVIGLAEDGLVVSQKLERVGVRWRGNLGWNKQLTFLPSGVTDGQQGRFYFRLDSFPRDPRVREEGSRGNDESKQIVVLMSGAIYSR